MVFTVLTPLPPAAVPPSDTMSAHASAASSNNRLRFPTSPGGGSGSGSSTGSGNVNTAVSRAARDSIISSSAKGWSPLQINKRDGALSPLRGSPQPSPNPNNASSSPNPNSADGPRRTSNSFKHVTRNSLVANSPFKNLATTQGKQAAGMEVKGKAEVMHERRTDGGRKLGETPVQAEGVGATLKAAIGLGISAKPRSTSRSASGSRSAGNGGRKVSGEKSKAAAADGRKVSGGNGGDRRVSGGGGGSGEREALGSNSKENESPNLHSSQRIPRQTSGVKGLKEGNHVSRSPFVVGVAGRRIPSGDMHLSPSPSPKTVPMSRHQHGVSLSPSPRRVSGGSSGAVIGQRKVSPAKAHLRNSRNSSPSHTPSPPRHFSHSNSLSHASPLGKQHFQTTAGPKSALTPSRRLLGPRHVLGGAGVESPSKQTKTVTFQSVPDVKEFEAISADGSFEVEVEGEGEGDSGSEYDRDWVDEAVEELEGDSLEEIIPHPDQAEKGTSGIEGGMAQLQLRVGNPDRENQLHPQGSTSPDDSSIGHGSSNNGHHDESTTADFVNTLIEEGLFSPNQTPALGAGETPVFEDQPTFEPSSTEDEAAPYLSTPSLGDEVLMSPMFDLAALTSNEPIDLPAKRKLSERDSAGVPYGRTHHAEWAAVAHALPPALTSTLPLPPLPQPDLPTTSDHTMLLNANASRPTLPAARAPQLMPLAHQVSPFHDPFITLQTATTVISPLSSRSENGAPLGRSSHMERINVARTLATQSLGLGMPRSPGRTASDEAERDVDDAGSESGSEVDSGSDDDERFFGPTPIKTAMTATKAGGAAVVEQRREVDMETPKKGLPRPQEIGVPSPVVSPPARVPEDKVEKRSSKLDFTGFALPLINMTSPFFRGTPTLEPQARVPSNDTSSQATTEDESRPITPPPTYTIPTAQDAQPITSGMKKDDSAHRIPSFEFEEIKLSTEEVLVRKATVLQNPHVQSPAKSVFPNPFDRPMSPPIAPFNKSTHQQSDPAPGSMRVRQRISREMIRETIDRKYADGSISRRPHSAMALGPTPSGSNESAQSHVLAARPASEILLETKRMSQYGGYSTSVAPPTLSASSSAASSSSSGTTTRNKDLPPPPPTGSTAMLKSATEVPRPSAPPALNHRPRSNTQAVGLNANEAIQRSSQMGNEPSSGLDRIIAGHVSPGPTLPAAGLPQRSAAAYGPTANIGQPISILQNPAQVPAVVPVGANPMRAASRAGAISSARQDDFGGESGSREKDGAGLSAIQEASRSSRRSRRSMSLGAADEDVRVPVAVRKQPRLTLGLGREEESMSEAFRDEMESISGDRNYKVREKHVLAASFGNTVSHSKAGDIDGGKAWRQLRRPSDINEHAAEIRAMRDREVSHGKASGTIFVKVLGIEGLVVPVPSQPTYFCITLDNGIDYIRTPYIPLQEGARVNQEFALVEHPNFEFSLSMDVRRDPHIIRALQDQNQLMVQSRIPSLSNGKPPPTSGGSGIRNLFSSPRKPKCTQPQSRPITPQPSLTPVPQGDTIARYLATPNSSTIAKTHVAFKPIAKQCEAKVLEIRYPMFAMFKGEPDRPREGARGSVPPNTPRKQVAKVTLQVFRLPPLPGVKPEDLPQCIDECLRGMRHHAWHECEYHEGNLTQEGGDCSIPRRRMFKVIGGNLVAYNEITRKEVATIDLRQATELIDLTPGQGAAGPRRVQRSATMDDEGMGMGVFGARPKSFKVEFKGGEGIVFSADRDEDKATWMETLNGLIGKIPSNPLWAELLASTSKEKQDRATARSVSRATMSSSAHTHSGPSQGQRSHQHQQHQHHASGGGNGDMNGRRRESSTAMGKTKSAPARAGAGSSASQHRPTASSGMNGISGGRNIMDGRKGEGIV